MEGGNATQYNTRTVWDGIEPRTNQLIPIRRDSTNKTLYISDCGSRRITPRRLSGFQANQSMLLLINAPQSERLKYLIGARRRPEYASTSSAWNGTRNLLMELLLVRDNPIPHDPHPPQLYPHPRSPPHQARCVAG